MRFAAFVVCAALGIGSAIVIASDRAQPTFRAGIDLVTFGVTAVDRKGNLVTDLTQDDFQILEDGKPQTLRYFTRGLGEGEGPAAHLGLMLDTSGSMEKDLKLARSAAIKFLNLLPEAEDITLVDFDTEVRVTRYPQRDFARLVERIRQRKPDGWTALYDALGVYLDGASAQQGRTILVMYTDGADSRSRAAVRRADGSAAGLAGHRLRRRAGREHRPDARRIDDAHAADRRGDRRPGVLSHGAQGPRRVLREGAGGDQGAIPARLSLDQTAQDGAWRKVEIKIKRPGLKAPQPQGLFRAVQGSPGLTDSPFRTA